MKKKIGFILLALLFLFLADEIEAKGKMEIQWKDSISLDEAEQALDKMQGTKNTFSLSQYVTDAMSGKIEFSFQEIWQNCISSVSDQWEKEKSTLFRILALGAIGGLFLGFSGMLGEKDLGDMGFYITFLLLFASISVGFHEIFILADEVIGNLLDFMKALIPAFSLSLCFTANTGTSLGFYETMLIGISILEALMKHILMPGVQAYFILAILNQLVDNRFSKMTELIHSFLRWTLKVMFGLLIGFQGIQGLLLPVMDKVKNNAIWQSAKGIPGIGNTVESVGETVLGSGMLLKSAIGVGGVIAIGIMCMIPILKLLVFTILYRAGGAFVQPISDRRIVNAIMATAESGKILLQYIVAGALMFLLSITIVIVCTNMSSV